RRGGVRDRGAVRHGAGALLQALGETDPQDGAPPPSLRAQRLAGAAGRGPILDRGRALRAAGVEHAQASMTRAQTPWFQGSRALVVGLARSGIAAAKLLLRHGSDVRGVDRRRAEELEGTVRELRDLGVGIAYGSTEPRELE